MKQLDFGPDGEQDKLTINRKFAKKFEFNKSREEFQKLQSKYGDESDSDSETEDEAGDLVTEDIEKGIQSVLEAIRNQPDKLKDKNLKFFPEITDQPDKAPKPKKEKSLTLKEYVLTQNNDDEEEQPETYVQQQGRHKQELIDEINAQDGGEDDDEDDFLQKRSKQRDIEPVALPDPEKDSEGFLDAFVNNKGWLNGRAYVDGDNKRDDLPELESDDEEFNEIAEKYESAYNFRFEDPKSVEIMSYARDQNTLRRKEDSSRRKQRDKERQQREEAESTRKREMARLRKLKVQQVTDRLEQLKEVLGDDRITAEDLEGDWDDNEWDQRMQKLFSNEFYEQEDDFKPQGVDDLKKEFGGLDDDSDEASEAEAEPEKSQKNKNKKSKEPAPQEQKPITKLSKKELKRKAEEFVDANDDLLKDEVQGKQTTFKYRQVDPESFGLTTEDILLADDRQLNMYVGLKKLASFRDKEKVSKDKKRYGKKKRLRQWRQEVWGTEDGPPADAWEKLKHEHQPPKHKHKKHKK